MKSIIFANFQPRDTSALQFTVGHERSEIQFLDDLSLNLWDCGGQDVFWENYFLHKEDIFSKVQCMIFVFNVDSKETQKELANYKRVIDALKEYSPNAKIFALIHKVDLIPRESQAKVFAQKESEVKMVSLPFRPTCFKTSIWDETLYKAWSEVVNSMIPKREVLLQHLQHFARIVEAQEVLLFEKATFLVLGTASSGSGRKYHDVQRFEKLANIVKQFKLGCTKCAKGTFTGVEVRNSNFAALMAPLTPNTFVLIVTEASIPSETTQLNLQNARTHFTNVFAQLRASENLKSSGNK